MIISYAELKKKPWILKGFAGVTAQEFEELEAKAEPLWQAQEIKRLERPDRQRAIGGGQRKTLPFREQLLMTLVWLRLYLVLEALGYLFGVDKSTASRYTNSVLPVLRQVGEAHKRELKHNPVPTCSQLPGTNPPDRLAVRAAGVGTPEFLALNGHNLTPSPLKHGLPPVQKAALELLRVELSKDPAKGVGRPDTVL